MLLPTTKSGSRQVEATSADLRRIEMMLLQSGAESLDADWLEMEKEERKAGGDEKEKKILPRWKAAHPGFAQKERLGSRHSIGLWGRQTGTELYFQVGKAHHHGSSLCKLFKF